jgi:hypothetical protein
MTYLNGVLDLMTPSVDHEGIKKTIARLGEQTGQEIGLSGQESDRSHFSSRIVSDTA